MYLVESCKRFEFGSPKSYGSVSNINQHISEISNMLYVYIALGHYYRLCCVSYM